MQDVLLLCSSAIVFANWYWLQAKPVFPSPPWALGEPAVSSNFQLFFSTLAATRGILWILYESLLDDQVSHQLLLKSWGRKTLWRRADSLVLRALNSRRNIIQLSLQMLIVPLSFHSYRVRQQMEQGTAEAISLVPLWRLHLHSQKWNFHCPQQGTHLLKKQRAPD